jgi:hypothetical protein
LAVITTFTNKILRANLLIKQKEHCANKLQYHIEYLLDLPFPLKTHILSDSIHIPEL